MAEPSPAGSGWHEDLRQLQPTPPPNTQGFWECVDSLGEGVRSVCPPNLPFLSLLKENHMKTNVTSQGWRSLRVRWENSSLSLRPLSPRGLRRGCDFSLAQTKAEAVASVSSLLCLTAALTVRPKAGASLEREGKPGASVPLAPPAHALKASCCLASSPKSSR